MEPQDLEGKKNYIIQKVKNLSKFEHIQIFKLLTKYNIKYSENSNGVFINLNYLSEAIITKIINFINFCIENKQLLQLEISKRDNLKKIINTKSHNLSSNFKPHSNKSETNTSLENGFSYEVDNNLDNNETYYKENTFIIPSL
jgi:hypothetical protein